MAETEEHITYYQIEILRKDMSSAHTLATTNFWASDEGMYCFKTTDEKIDDLSTTLDTKFDELLTEIRGLREDVRNSSCKYPDTKL